MGGSQPKYSCCAYSLPHTADQLAVVLNATSDHINGSRFTLRFLMGLGSLHGLVNGSYKDLADPENDSLRLTQKVVDVGTSRVPTYFWECPRGRAEDCAHRWFLFG